MEVPTSRNIRIGLFILLAAVAVFFSTYKLTESPSFWYDEGWYFQHAANLSEGHIDGLQFAPGDIRHLAITTVGYPLIYPMALWMKVFGVNVLSARSLMVVFILGLLAAGFFLSKRLFGPNVALASLALLATFPPLYGNGKSVLGEVPGLLFLILALLALHASLSATARKRLFLALSGIFLGLCIVTKPIFLVFLPAFAIAVLVGLKRKDLSWKDIGTGLVFAALPVIVWGIVQFGAGDSASTILGYYANPYYKTDLLGTVIGNVKTMLRDPSTLYTLLLMAVWAAGLWLRARLKERIPAIEIAGAVFSVLIMLAFLRSEGWFRYIFEAQIVTLLFFPYSLSILCRHVLPKFRFAKAGVCSTALIVLLGLLGAYQTAFRSFVAEAYASHKTAYWQDYFRDIPESTSVLFNNVPEVVPFIRHRNYHQFISCAAGQFGKEELAAISKGQVELIVMRTDSYDAADKDLKDYRVSSTAYKYTILERRY